MKSAVDKRRILGMLRERHRRCRKGLKGGIITELCELLEEGRKQAIRVLNESEVGRPGKPGKRGRPGKYQDKAFKDALRKIWKITRYPCRRALKSAVPLWPPAIEEDSGAFSTDVRERLFAISAPTIDETANSFLASSWRKKTQSC